MLSNTSAVCNNIESHYLPYRNSCTHFLNKSCTIIIMMNYIKSMRSAAKWIQAVDAKLKGCRLIATYYTHAKNVRSDIILAICLLFGSVTGFKAISNLDPLIITATPTWNLFENPRCPHAYSILTDQIFHTTVYNHIKPHHKVF